MTKKTETGSANPFGDLSKLMEQFKIPGVDMSAIVETHRKDMDALVAANVATLESVQALAKKQTEILTRAQQGAIEAAKALSADPSKHADLARAAYEKAIADMKALADMAQKAQSDIVAAINARASQSLQEIQALLQPK